ncbi:MAG: hypothetical protein HC828_03680 [Blastochloris sp.]|nr:hypothetical protein [Blastochloris sp.]
MRFEDSSAALTTTGTWASSSNSLLSGGTVRQSKTANSTISLTLSGTWVSIGFRTVTNAGNVDVAIDGVSQEVVDTYSRTEGTLTRVYSDLSAGSHTLTLTVLGQRQAFSSDNWVVLDYVDVWDGAPLTQGTFEHDHARVYRGTNWTTQTSSTASGGSYLRDGSNVWFPFTGTSVSFDAVTESWAGEIQVFVDGVSQGVFDLRSSSTGTRRISFGNLAGYGLMSFKFKPIVAVPLLMPFKPPALRRLSRLPYRTGLPAMKKIIPICGLREFLSGEQVLPGACLAIPG